ncbi:MAG: discoidin domain-containing protein [Bacteroidales bacterium]|nr:discoidin domain-containing protein [Bacteroidales bacterium]
MRKSFNCLTIIIVLASLAGCADNGGNGGRRTLSLDGVWEAAIAADADSDEIPATFDRRIPVPGHFPLMTPEAEYSTHGALWYRTTYKAPRDLPPRVVLRIAKAEFGRTIFINGEKADFYPYNFSASETDIRPFLKAGEENEILVRVKSVEDVLTDGSPVANNGSDYERMHYYPGIFDSVTIIESGWPAVIRIETRAELDRGAVSVRATIFNGGDSPADGTVRFAVGRNKVKVEDAPLQPEETRQVTVDIPLKGFDPEKDNWTPEHPRLYTVTASTAGDSFSTRFGMRTFKVDPENERFLLNGEERFLLGTNTDLFRFFDDPQCGGKPWDEAWMRQLFASFKEIGWDSFRNCISAAPELWYDLSDEMGLMIQDEYPFWTCGDRRHTHTAPVNGETLLPEYMDWLRDRGTHPSIVIIDLQNESLQPWFRDLAAALKPHDFQGRPFEIGWTTPNPDKNDVREYHPYLYIKSDFSPGYLNFYDGTVTDGTMSIYPGGQDDGLTKIINEYGWDWINRNGDATILGKGNYDHNLPADATRDDRREYYAWSVGLLTEFWRVRAKIAGIHHFTSLTYSFEDAGKAWTGDILSPDITTPVIRPEVVERFKSAFAPVTVVVDDYREDVLAGMDLEPTIVLINESRDGKAVSREVTAELKDAGGNSLLKEVFTLEAEAHGRASRTVKVNVPEDASRNLIFTASLPEGPVSIRKWEVLRRPQGFALGRAVTESSRVPDLYHGGRPGICVTDGSPRTRWLPAVGDTSPWISIDLGTERNVSECDIAWVTEGGNVLAPERCRVRASIDGVRYKDVALLSAGLPEDSTWQTITFPTVSARYIKISSDGKLPAGTMSISEIEVR